MGSSSCSKGIGEGDHHDQLHVLAVDDSVIERKLLEALLKNSSYKGMINVISENFLFLLTTV